MTSNSVEGVRTLRDQDISAEVFGQFGNTAELSGHLSTTDEVSYILIFINHKGRKNNDTVNKQRRKTT